MTSARTSSRSSSSSSSSSNRSNSRSPHRDRERRREGYAEDTERDERRRGKQTERGRGVNKRQYRLFVVGFWTIGSLILVSGAPYSTANISWSISVIHRKSCIWGVCGRCPAEIHKTWIVLSKVNTDPHAMLSFRPTESNHVRERIYLTNDTGPRSFIKFDTNLLQYHICFAIAFHLQHSQVQIYNVKLTVKHDRTWLHSNIIHGGHAPI